MLLILALIGLVASDVIAPVPPPPPPHRDAPDMPPEMLAMQACRTLSRNDLLSCFSQLVDTNNDGSLSSTEINTFLDAQHIPASTVLMRLCDTDSDGSLTMTDWNAGNACAQSQPIITRACYICVRAGWSSLTTTTTTTTTTAPSKK